MLLLATTAMVVFVAPVQRFADGAASDLLDQAAYQRAILDDQEEGP